MSFMFRNTAFETSGLVGERLAVVGLKERVPIKPISLLYTCGLLIIIGFAKPELSYNTLNPEHRNKLILVRKC